MFCHGIILAMKRLYELMVILRPDIDPSDAKTVETIVNKLVSDGSSFVKDLSVVGKKPLAYPIKKQSEGVYALATIESPHVDISRIERTMRLGADVLRYLITRKE